MFKANISDEETSKKFYSKKYFTDLHPSCFFFDLNKDIKKADFIKALSIVEKYIKRGKLLDVGCGTGLFMRVARQRGWKVQGIDISDFIVRQARSYDLDVMLGGIENVKLPKKYFDVIVMWASIEHLFDPFKSLDKIRNALKRGGILVIVTDNYDSIVQKISEMFYRLGVKYFLEHTMIVHNNYFFTRETLMTLLNKTGFQTLESHPTETYINKSDANQIVKMVLKLIHLFDKIVTMGFEILIVGKKVDNNESRSNY